MIPAGFSDLPEALFLTVRPLLAHPASRQFYHEKKACRECGDPCNWFLVMASAVFFRYFALSASIYMVIGVFSRFSVKHACLIL